MCAVYDMNISRLHLVPASQGAQARACGYGSKVVHIAAAAHLRSEVSLSAWFGSSDLVGLVADEGDDHAVEVEEEHDEVEAKLDEGFLLMDVELSENLGRVKEVLVLEDFLCVPGKQRQVEDQGDPVPVDEEQNGDESVDGSFGDNVGVEAVAKVNRVDVVAFQIAVHDGEEDLKEEVDGIDKHCYQVEPRFSRHDCERGYENASVVVGSGVVGDVSRSTSLYL